MEQNYGHWDEINEPIESDDIGFVYMLTEKTTGKFYIGQKLLKNKTVKKPLKGKVNKRRGEVESDWKTYLSSGAFAGDNPEKYHKQILTFHKTKTDLNIAETYAIILNIRNPLNVNQCINIRVRVRK